MRHRPNKHAGDDAGGEKPYSSKFEFEPFKAEAKVSNLRSDVSAVNP